MFRASWRAALIGAVVAAVATLPALGVGTLWDNSETAYGEVAREVLLSQDAIVMHLNGVAWFVQPPLYFWIAAAFAHLFGVSAFALRLPSALATIAMSAVVGWSVARHAPGRVATLAATVLATSLMQAVVGRLAIMDAMLDLAVTVAIVAWFEFGRSGNRRGWYLGIVALALGMLTKGLVAPAVTLMVVVPWAIWSARSGDRVALPGVREIAWGAALFATVTLPWALAVLHAAGPAALEELFGHYTVGRYLGTIENQSGPIWYYLPVVILGFFPWFAFLVPALVDGARSAGERDGTLARLAIVWAVLPFVFFSFARTKLPNYIALELPALAILVALWFERALHARSGIAARAWTAIVPVTIVLVGIAAAVFSRDNRLTGDLLAVRGDFIALGGVILAGSLVCFALLFSPRRAWLAPFALAAASVSVVLIIAFLGVPAVERFKPIPSLADTIERLRRPGDVIAIEGVSGGNALVFYTQPHVVQIPPDDDVANSRLRTAVCAAERALVVTSKRRPSPDPTFGRTRSVVAMSNNDVLYMYDGPACTETATAQAPGTPSKRSL